MDKTDDKSQAGQTFDPLHAWREWYQKSEKQWSDALSGLLGSEKFAQATGKYAQEAMHLHRMFNEAMAQYLSAINVPSRSDLTELGERLGQLEDTLAGLQVEVRHLRRSLTESDPAAEPPRTKQPKPPASKG